MAGREVAAACLVAFTVALVAAPVAAQQLDPSSLSEEDRQELGRLFSRAKSAYESENYREAIAALSQAHELFPEPNILYRIGDAYENLGELEPAIEYYRRYVEAAPDASDSGLVSRRIEDLERRLASLRESVQDEPADQEPEDAAFLIDTNPPGAAVRVDGDLVGSTTPVRLAVVPGAHTIEISLERHASLTRDVVVEAGETISLVYQLERHETPRGPGALPWVIAGAGLVGAGVGTGLLVGASSAARRVEAWDAEREQAYANDEQVPDRPADYDGTKRRSVVWRNAGIAAVGGGVLMLAGGVVWLAVAPRPGDGGEVAVVLRF